MGPAPWSALSIRCPVAHPEMANADGKVKQVSARKKAANKIKGTVKLTLFGRRLTLTIDH